MSVKLLQTEFFMSDIVDAPLRFECKLHHATQCQAEGDGKSGPQIAFAVLSIWLRGARA